jgi:hypothetical protein
MKTILFAVTWENLHYSTALAEHIDLPRGTPLFNVIVIEKYEINVLPITLVCKFYDFRDSSAKFGIVQRAVQKCYVVHSFLKSFVPQGVTKERHTLEFQ